MSLSIAKALGQIMAAVVQSITEAGADGVAGGVLYAALTGHGCSFPQFQQMMQVLVDLKKVRKDGEFYVAVRS